MVEAAPGREVELKLEIASGDPAALLASPRLRELASGRARRQALRSVYYDTTDLALWRAGLVLRVRELRGRRSVGVKTRGVVRGGLVAREEVEAPLAADVANAARVPRSLLCAAIAEPRLRDAVEKAAAGRPLAARVETEVARVVQLLRSGEATIELALDQGEVRAGRHRLPIRELELELLSGPGRALFDTALRLVAAGDLRPSSLGKAERGFARLLGEAPAAARAESIELRHDAPHEEAIRLVLGECLRHVTENRGAAEHSDDPEGVHQMRVGTRRLRSALALFEPWLPVRTARALSEELRWLGRSLGQARELDVFFHDLLAPLARSRPDDKGLAALCEAADAARVEAHAAVRTLLASRRYTRLVLRLGRFVEAPFRRSDAAALRAPARRAARRILGHRAKKMRERAKGLEQRSPDELHRLRIRAKRLRYAIELLGSLFGGKPPARTAKRLAVLQDTLGHLNDLANAEALLAQLRERSGVSATLATVRAEGFVLGYAERSSASSRDELAHVWQRVARTRPFWE
jgi:inorganic triphosphatase YgiF